MAQLLEQRSIGGEHGPPEQWNGAFGVSQGPRVHVVLESSGSKYQLASWAIAMDRAGEPKRNGAAWMEDIAGELSGESGCYFADARECKDHRCAPETAFPKQKSGRWNRRGHKVPDHPSGLCLEGHEERHRTVRLIHSNVVDAGGARGRNSAGVTRPLSTLPVSRLASPG